MELNGANVCTFHPSHKEISKFQDDIFVNSRTTLNAPEPVQHNILILAKNSSMVLQVFLVNWQNTSSTAERGKATAMGSCTRKT